MNVEIGTESPIFLFWEYLFQIFGILSLQCRPCSGLLGMKGLMGSMQMSLKVVTCPNYLYSCMFFDPQDLYCGTMNCYDLLGVTRDADRGAIAKVAILFYSQIYLTLMFVTDTCLLWYDVPQQYCIQEHRKPQPDSLFISSFHRAGKISCRWTLIKPQVPHFTAVSYPCWNTAQTTTKVHMDFFPYIYSMKWALPCVFRLTGSWLDNGIRISFKIKPRRRTQR